MLPASPKQGFLTTCLLFHGYFFTAQSGDFWRAKVYASGNLEEEIDFTYVIIGVTLGAFLAIGFVAVIICMIKNQMIDNVFGGRTWDRAKTGMTSMY
ncbi:transmembrane protein 273 isoform X3 [Accipiter gentilis]|uniref:transmembrane protein 273 isoform X3 n=1 Tax=Astur gentilis TaxID=8957 RepID=UPI0021104505|nr:transmembrane protein 273 isoform X3 [Accipiter gentilis]